MSQLLEQILSRDTIEDCPTKGHTHYDMIKQLDDSSDEIVIADPCAFEIQSGDEDDAKYIDDKLVEYNWSQVPAVHDFEFIGRKIQGDMTNLLFMPIMVPMQKSMQRTMATMEFDFTDMNMEPGSLEQLRPASKTVL